MGVYFEYDFKNGKEVEKAEKCYLCDKEDVVYAEYYILEGDVYKLYKDARKIIKGREVQVGSINHSLCPSCIEAYPLEEDLISAILKKRVVEKKEDKKKEVENLQKKIEEKQAELKAKQEEVAAVQKEIDEMKSQLEALKKEIGGK